jgi:hypothetical protein
MSKCRTKLVRCIELGLAAHVALQLRSTREIRLGECAPPCVARAWRAGTSPVSGRCRGSPVGATPARRHRDPGRAGLRRPTAPRPLPPVESSLQGQPGRTHFSVPPPRMPQSLDGAGRPSPSRSSRSQVGVKRRICPPRAAGGEPNSAFRRRDASEAGQCTGQASLSGPSLGQVGVKRRICPYSCSGVVPNSAFRR